MTKVACLSVDGGRFFLLKCNREVTWISGRGHVYTRVKEVKCIYKPSVCLL